VLERLRLYSLSQTVASFRKKCASPVALLPGCRSSPKKREAVSSLVSLLNGVDENN
jgi:hypothetical protein